jgi:hypothetical protein
VLTAWGSKRQLHAGTLTNRSMLHKLRFTPRGPTRYVHIIDGCETFANIISLKDLSAPNTKQQYVYNAYSYCFMSGQECMAMAMQRYPCAEDGGYLVIGDDTIIDPCQVRQRTLNKAWEVFPCCQLSRHPLQCVHPCISPVRPHPPISASH